MFGSIVIKPDILYLCQSKKKNPLLVSNCIIAKKHSTTAELDTIPKPNSLRRYLYCSQNFTTYIKLSGKGHNYENHYVESQKEHQKICRPSLCRKSPLK